MLSLQAGETQLENMVVGWFDELGYGTRFGPSLLPDQPITQRRRRAATSPPDQISFGPDFVANPSSVEREHPDEGFLPDRLRTALVGLNPDLPPEALQEAYRKVTIPDTPNLIENNHRFHAMLTGGVEVGYRTADGRDAYRTARLVDFQEPANNDWLVVNQFSVVENQHHRRADVVVFVNGLPLAVIELKDPSSESASVYDAYCQLQTYQHEIPALFTHNELLVVSDGLDARAACMTSNWEWFLPWKTIDGDVIDPPGLCRLEVLIKGIFEPRRLLDLVRNFVVFESDGGRVTKKMARYHQYHAVNRALESTFDATSVEGDRKAGVVWHTQGSGKSLTMAFYAGKVIQAPVMENPTILVTTDRLDLDDQLLGTFCQCSELLRQEPVHAEDRDQLRELLRVPAGGVIFTTIQKFMPEVKGDEFPCLSDRRNIVVICDEAHRSQYDFKDGYARHIRKALPNASFIAFTGTPVELIGRNTQQVFGDYIAIYDIRQSVADGATVPIYYEGRLIEIALREQDKELLDEEFDDITEDEEFQSRERLKTKWARLEALVGAEDRVKRVAADLVAHFEGREEENVGKGMVVCMSRRICVALYDAIAELRPNWVGASDEDGRMKIVMTGSAADRVEWQQHIRNKSRREALAARFKNPDDPFDLVIVRDMWLTGFDVPCLHTMYLDKPMQGHGLMQAIARVNRVFLDKSGGRVVDYLGLADSLRRALQRYSDTDREETGIDQSKAVGKMLEEFDIVCSIFHGFDYSSSRGGTLGDWLPLVIPALEHLLALSPSGEGDDPRKRFKQHMVALSRAFALSVPDPQALSIRDDVRFFELVRAALLKTTGGAGARDEDVETAIRQVVSRAVLAGGVKDIFAAAGLENPDISVLSAEFLDEVRGMKHKNIAAEALRRLLADQIALRERKNPLEARSFAKMLEQSINRYRNRSIQAAQVIEELIEIAKGLRAAVGRGEDMGLTEDELAFYDALAQNESAVECMGDAQLRVIAREVLEAVRRNATIDWSVREAARARLRVVVKHILRKYGYPPDLEKAATDTVLEQTEALCEQWVEA